MVEVLGLGTWRHFLTGPKGRQPFGFSLAMSCKDYDVGIGVAAGEHVPVPGLAAVQQAMHAILDELGPEADLVDYVTVLERNAHVELPNHGHLTTHERSDAHGRVVGAEHDGSRHARDAAGRAVPRRALGQGAVR